MEKLLFLFFFILGAEKLARAFPLSPVQCSNGDSNCSVSSTYGTWPDRSTCRAARAFFPSTEPELLAAVAFGARNKLKMKVVSRSSHSITKLVCPGGDQGLVISTRDYNRVFQVDPASSTASVSSGVELQQLVNALASFGLALPHSPYWNGLSIGGLITTGAHGSSLVGKGAAVHEYVTAIRMVIPAGPEDGYSKTINISANDWRFNAARVSLGVLGVISQVTLALQPMFKRSVSVQTRTDARLEDEVLEFGRSTEFGDIAWYPSQKRALYRVDNRVPLSTPGDGVNDFIGFRPERAPVLKALRFSEELYEATNNAFGKCIMSRVQLATLLSAGMGLRNTLEKFNGFPVIGLQNRIQTTGTCESTSDSFNFCPWDPRGEGLFFHQTTVSISLNKIRDFILDVKRLRDTNPNGFCGAELYYGVLMRYVRASSAYLGKAEDSVDVDITYYRAKDAAAPRLNEDLFEEIEQIAVFKYQGQPHWGKNRNVAFIGVSDKYPGMSNFLRVKQALDPHEFFSSEWSDSMLGRGEASGVTTDKDHCALEGLCICSKDEHCSLKRKYYCRPGKVFENARVCRRES